MLLHFTYPCILFIVSQILLITSNAVIAINTTQSAISALSQTEPVYTVGGVKNDTEKEHSRGIVDTSIYPGQSMRNKTQNVSSTNTTLITPTVKNEVKSEVKNPSVVVETKKSSENSTTSTTLSSSTSTTTKATTTTTTTVKPKPKKPTITTSVLDNPADAQKIQLLKNEPPLPPLETKVNASGPKQSPGIISSNHGSSNRFIAPMVGAMFAVPLVFVILNYAKRQFREYWSKRRYRRMDYLIDEMYN